MNTINSLLNKYRELFDAVKKWHHQSELAHRGHGLDHDITVAVITLKIAPDTRTGEMAFISALLHSTDRTIEGGDVKKLEEKLFYFLELLPPAEFTDKEVSEIFEAVIGHSDLNNESQPLVQQVLMDADRLANMMMHVVFRIGQFWPDIPALEFECISKPNPLSTYSSPLSALDMLRGIMSKLEHGNVGYIEQLRLPKAIEIGRHYHNRLSKVIEMIEEDHRNLGLIDLTI